jgi:hypothetical protein
MTMKLIIQPTLALLALLTLAILVKAAPPVATVTPGTMLCCPADYCRKPLPCVVRTGACCPDDYCRKPLPCKLPVGPFCCDDYCAKPLPVLCWPCLPLNYRTRETTGSFNNRHRGPGSQRDST